MATIRLRRRPRFYRSPPLASVFLSPATKTVSLGFHSGVKDPGLMLRVLAIRFNRPFSLWLHHRARFAPVPAVSLPDARCGLCEPRRPLPPLLPLPFRSITSLRIKAFRRFAASWPAFRFARSPFAPRSRFYF